MSGHDSTTPGKDGLLVRCWTTPKNGSSENENEDAYRVAETETGWLIALSDGATEAVYSRDWARALVESATPDWPEMDDADLLIALNNVRAGFSPIAPDSPTPWYVRNKYFEQGSQATLLVISLVRDPEGYTIQALAIGDCCLILMHPDGGVRSFPMERAEEFGVNPALIRSRTRDLPTPLRTSGRLDAGAMLLACTDAVGRWALELIEDGRERELIGHMEALARRKLLSVTTNPDESDVSPSSTERGFGAKLRSLALRLGLAEEIEKREQPVAVIASTETADEPSYSDFIAQAREADSVPCMRNDDVTLILCLPDKPHRADDVVD